jgi:hypothetical protein
MPLSTVSYLDTTTTHNRILKMPKDPKHGLGGESQERKHSLIRAFSRLTVPSTPADRVEQPTHAGVPADFYHAVIDLSSTTITLDNKVYKVFPGGISGRADPAVQELMDRYGKQFRCHGESLTSRLMRYWGAGWVYVKRDVDAVALPKSFYLLEVKEEEDVES